ncbi:surfactant protein Bb [Anarrhichthys ocellatus]|uniref:surfactant protein Bb n=1 Tax=Anarrhichthys ocellatus TaxID=433405 RepID=UPI0012ED9552|nr:pulmonary surfactant-associated protein B [Anarrhichthys ocellatus]
MSASGFILVVLAVSLWPGDCRLIIDPFSLIKQKSLTLDMCLECSQVVQLSANMISSRDTKETVYETLYALCQRLPREQASECDSQVKVYLPKVLQQTPGHLKPGETCMVFGLCAAHKEELLKPSHHATNAVSGSKLGSATTTHLSGQFNPACSLCLFIINKLETLLPKNMTEDALMKIMEEVCDLLPHSYKDQCDDFVDKYGTQIIEFLLSSAAPHTICILLHVCLFEEQPLPELSLPSDCEFCRTLAVLSRLHLGLNSTEPQTSSFLQSVCVLHPNAIPKCEAFIQIYSSRLQKVLGNQMDAQHPCERAGLCVAVKKLEPLGKNRCTWGPSYWCKDIQTAQKCGNQAFCEKYMWKE